MPPSTRTLAALLRRYGAGEALACEPLTEGLLNRGYRLATTRGSFFLKHHLDGDPEADLDADPDPPAAPLDRLLRQHRATAALARLGLPVVPPLADRDGHTIAVHAGRRYALHPWVEGQHRAGGELSAPDCRRLGALLGRVHRGLEHVIGQVKGRASQEGPEGRGGREMCEERAGREGPEGREGRTRHAGRERDDGCQGRAGLAVGRVPAQPLAHAPAGGGPAPGPRTAPRASAAAADPADTLALVDRLLARVRCQPSRGAFDELAEHRLLERRGLLREHAHRRPERSQIPASGWVHGDFHPLNLLYQATRPAAIIDWDRLGLRPRAEEVVRAAAIFFIRPDGSLELPKIRAYARAYRLATRTGAEEMAAAVHRVWWERLNDFWMLRWHYERGDHRADPQFPATAALVVWWTRNPEAVRDAFCD